MSLRFLFLNVTYGARSPCTTTWRKTRTTKRGAESTTLRFSVSYRNAIRNFCAGLVILLLYADAPFLRIQLKSSSQTEVLSSIWAETSKNQVKSRVKKKESMQTCQRKHSRHASNCWNSAVYFHVLYVTCGINNLFATFHICAGLQRVCGCCTNHCWPVGGKGKVELCTGFHSFFIQINARRE